MRPLQSVVLASLSILTEPECSTHLPEAQVCGAGREAGGRVSVRAKVCSVVGSILCYFVQLEPHRIRVDVEIGGSNGRHGQEINELHHRHQNAC